MLSFQYCKVKKKEEDDVCCDTKSVMDRRRKWPSSVLQKGEEHGSCEMPFTVVLAFLKERH